MDIQWVRNQFPALQNNFTFMDNAGGSQVLQQVLARINHFMVNYNVQLGASYEVSALAGQVLDEATTRMAQLINAPDPKEVVIGPSTSMLIRILSLCLSRTWQPGDEVIVTNSDHEANVSPWVDLQKHGIVVKTWRLNHESYRFEIDDLEVLLTDKTKLVAIVHTSNILGTINPIREFADLVHKNGTLLCVDGVAYAPHRKVDVRAFDADFYVFSTYKTYGPHQAVMYGKRTLLEQMPGINHYFLEDAVPYKFQPGNFNFELCYGMVGLAEYLHNFHAHHFERTSGPLSQREYQACFECIADHEAVLAERLIQFLMNKPKVRIIGEASWDKGIRVPTISFVHDDLKSSDIVKQVDKHRIGIRFGDFYAKRLIHDLDLERKDGVVRVSLVHYNTLNEVDRLIEVFDPIL